MSYTPFYGPPGTGTGWEDGLTGGTPVDAAALDNMEAGIIAATNQAAAALQLPVGGLQDGNVIGWDASTQQTVAVDLSGLTDLLSSTITAVKLADQVRSGSNPAWADTELAFYADTAADYQVTVDLYLNGDATGDFECGWTLPSGFTSITSIIAPVDTAAATGAPPTKVTFYGIPFEAWSNTDTAQNPGSRAGRSPRIGTTGVMQKLRVDAVITANAPGAVFFAWSQYTAAAGGSEGCRVYAKSRLVAVRRSSTTGILNGAQWVENGNVYTAQTPQQPWNLKLAADYARLEIRPGDQWAVDLAAGKGVERVQLAGHRVALNTSIWTAFRFRLNGLINSTNDTLIYQMKQAPENGASAEFGKRPSVSIWFLNGNLEICTCGDPNAITTKDTYQVNFATRYSTPWVGVHPVDGTEWVDVVLRQKMHWTAGELDVWIKGVQVLSLTGICNGYNDSQAGALPTPCFDIYRGRQAVTTVAEFVNLEVGTADLSARVASPLPLPTIP